ncbi:hypothetical protein RIF29_38031 [Crotalaria pallida]|uniref:Uncharacterized protein n=1 Tax=Crotalaria pallida TaxID=3830 RepID=A0AAN9HL60_CROPI
MILQAIIRVCAVRRQAMNTLKCLQSIVSIQTKVCARRLQMVEGRCNCAANEEIQDSNDKIIRRSAESERNKVKGRWRYWLEQWVDTQLSKHKELEDLDSVSAHILELGRNMEEVILSSEIFRDKTHLKD